MHKPIEFVSKAQTLGINIATDIYDKQVSDTVSDVFANKQELERSNISVYYF